ncbi:type II secretory pathway, ATPase PulE/Tfp pilus assembly pathway, ATPase PilB [Halobacteroides halobius DSM 5150]|uniref:Type II secretory pathway, ATPase PulE/Tfp pilus assembly pathway, ATPase PilB n=1 Tax=Halobacteroides halobius (strain ATCC 35273 / DSM 5150 / MD-1) TaxID=748449 RepID=L0K8W5_HALHC|nr:ATPase, T2SS/T4P/T4SS family [Halobacteroides halobius]AGB41727.1 type II secretory pathway, ATPase PulE/Tfp pilus assembly pathway, ATPase PilB [Halobacteroides halobius DSM 5150]
MIKKKRLGDILVEAGFITEEELNEALKRQKNTEQRLGNILKRMGLVTDESVMEALEFQLGIPRLDLKQMIIDPEVINMIPKSLAERHKAIPVKQKDNALTVAMADPLDILAIDDIRIKTNCEVIPGISSEEEIQNAINQYFGETDIVNEFMEDVDLKIDRINSGQLEDNNLQQMVEDAPIVRLVNSIIARAVKARASDIHIEPDEDQVQVRYRIDGILHTEMNIPKQTLSALVSRIKIMAEMDIAERRLPQDGRIQMKLANTKVDLRISTLPTVEGEKVVIRILDKDNVMLSIDELGLSVEAKPAFKKMINQPHGMLLITGPTGSGKTTTLYSALNFMDASSKNIITVEDPVEYKLKGVNQVQTNSKAGLSFANGLRSILRQDPDVIMIGEIRDKETAKIAIHAAMTGHLVLSTLHTNQSAGALTRLIDMGIEPYLVASSVLGVIAQRLVRKICDNCKVESEKLLPPKTLEVKDSFKHYQGEGCRSCNQAGYKRRTAIYELLEVEAKIKELVVEKVSAAKIESVAKTKGMNTLEDAALKKVEKGITSLEEAMRVTKI